ncbi:MAG: hypothetical protein WCF84_22895 [Anaerolineae bacterium]
MADRLKKQGLRVIISVLALGDGVLHLLLNFVLFRGAGRPAGTTPPVRPSGGPPPGGARFPTILPLNDLFILNFVGEVILVLLFLFSRRLLGARRWLVDVAMIGYAAVTFVAWILFGMPNPMGLGYLSKGVEIVLIIALLTDLWGIFRERTTPRSSTQAQAEAL